MKESYARPQLRLTTATFYLLSPHHTADYNIESRDGYTLSTTILTLSQPRFSLYHFLVYIKRIN